MRLVGAEDLLNLLRRSALAPLDVDRLHVESQPLHHVDPEVAELAVAERQNLVAGRESIAQGCFPAAGSAGGEDERLPVFGLEDLAQLGEEPERQLGEDRGAVILHRDVHRAQDPIGRIGRTGDEKMVADQA